ncbi:MAG: TonB C-terminal domain-containing protein [Rhizobacter sp.]|nr:TonB C-terminal domain-containing protein [Rhizobacter sp.]
MYQDDEPQGGRSWVKTLALWGVALGLGVGVVLLMMQYLATPATKPRGVQQVALIKQPPPPPPPKPPEKVPEPPKVKEEVKIDEPKDEPKPDEPKPADDKPAADKPLAVDADGAAGSDGFGLAGKRGGSDLLTTGGGSGAYYSGLVQRHFFEALTRNRKVLKDEFRVVVKIWIGDDGRVKKADIVNGSGNVQVDDLIQVTLLEMSPLKDVPPSSMRPIQLRLSNRS